MRLTKLVGLILFLGVGCGSGGEKDEALLQNPEPNVILSERVFRIDGDQKVLQQRSCRQLPGMLPASGKYVHMGQTHVGPMTVELLGSPLGWSVKVLGADVGAKFYDFDFLRAGKMDKWRLGEYELEYSGVPECEGGGDSVGAAQGVTL